MGHLLNKIEGAVFFVDILGFGALTQNKIKLDKGDFNTWNIPKHLPKDNQTLAATILVEFRKVLRKLDKIYSTVKIAQLSDCAFVWSENISDVIIVAHRIMWDCLNNGILCRAGFSCGEIIETSENNELGRFIVGEAVSNAVKLEGVAKGARIMINTDVPHTLCDYDKKFHSKIYPLFQPFTNLIDYQTYDEFKWYYVDKLSKDMQELNKVNKCYILDATKSRLKLAANLRLHPKFSWNSKGKDGVAQLNPSISFISANEQTIFRVSHWFEWNRICDKRSKKSLDKLKNTIDSDFLDFRVEDNTIILPEP